MCKRRHIRGISALKKDDLVKKIKTYESILKIQKWFRKKLIKDNVCPITLEKVTYPCFCFCPTKDVFIYYNLNDLRSYLLSTGNFIDPKTRIEYSKKQLIEIGKDVYAASKNTKRYKKIKEKEWRKN